MHRRLDTIRYWEPSSIEDYRSKEFLVLNNNKKKNILLRKAHRTIKSQFAKSLKLGFVRQKKKIKLYVSFIILYTILLFFYFFYRTAVELEEHAAASGILVPDMIFRA